LANSHSLAYNKSFEPTARPLTSRRLNYWLLQQLIMASQGPDSMLKKAIGGDWKGKLSLLLYAAAIPVAFWWQWISLGLYVVGALLWLIPDRRIENVLRSADTSPRSGADTQ
jgi:hypothetical protein